MIISNLFSSAEGITIEKFTILQKIEKVKELLSYGELTASEIAFKMGYSSAASRHRLLFGKSVYERINHTFLPGPSPRMFDCTVINAYQKLLYGYKEMLSFSDSL